MSKVVTTFLDALAERLTGLVASIVASRVAVLQTQVQADQQSYLEDLARRLEADGKPAIAAKVRERAVLLASPELAGEGNTYLRQLGIESNSPFVAPLDRSPVDLRSLPDFRQTPAKQRRKRSETSLDSFHAPSLDDLGQPESQEAQQ